MKKSTEMWKQLDSLKNEIKTMREAGQIEQAHAKLEELETLKKDIEVQERLEQDELEGFEGTPVLGKNKENTNMETDKIMGKQFYNVINPGEKLTADKSDKHNQVDLGKLVNAMITGNWSNALTEKEYMNETMQTDGNKIIIPTHLRNTILDLARAKSAIMGKVPTVELKNSNLTIAKLTKDVEGHWVAEGETIPTSTAAFEGVKLQSKVLATLVPVSERLMKDAPNLTEVLYDSISSAVAEAMDKAIMYGTGDGTETAKEPKGITRYTGINKVAVTGTEFGYDDMTQAIKPIKKANLKPSQIVMNTDEELEMLSTKDSTGRYLDAPKTLEGITIDSSNNVTEGQAFAFDPNSMLVGLGYNFIIEKGYMAGQFEKLEQSIRCWVGIDVVVLQEQGITEVKRTASKSK